MRIGVAVIASLIGTVGLFAQDDPSGGDRGFDVVPDTPPTAPVTDIESTATRYGTYHALLVAIEQYDHEGFSTLLTPKRDVTTIGKTLRESYGFDEKNIRTLIDEEATRKGILHALRSYRSLGAGDNLLVYFAGHGDLHPETKEGFWIPSDASDDPLDWISIEEVKKQIGFLQARHVLLVADSCYSGALLRSSGDLRRTQTRVDSLANDDSREVMASGGLEPVADGGKEGMSIFAYSFVKSLRDNEEPYFLSRDLFVSVDRLVSSNTASLQVPQFGEIRGAGHEFGQFIFENIDVAGGDDSLPEPTVVDNGVPLGWFLPASVEWSVREDGSFSYENRQTGGGEMVLVPAGSYVDAQGKTVLVEEPFLIDVHEVTVDRFQAYMNEHPEENLRYWRQPGYDDPDQPVVGVGLDVARAFATWARMRLPTEIEWEYAAAFHPTLDRLRRYPWGDTFEHGEVVQATYPPPVGSCLQDVSHWGVRGMGSGVREWCLLPDGRNDRRWLIGVIRGASQVGSGRRFRLDEPVAARREADASVADPHVGFRCIAYLLPY